MRRMFHLVWKYDKSDLQKSQGSIERTLIIYENAKIQIEIDKIQQIPIESCSSPIFVRFLAAPSSQIKFKITQSGTSPTNVQINPKNLIFDKSHHEVNDINCDCVRKALNYALRAKQEELEAC